MPVKRTYVLELNDGDGTRPDVVRTAELFEWAAHSLRNEADGTGPAVSHECECYGTAQGTLAYVPEELRHAA